MSPVISSSGLSPGSREANVQRAKVCLNCTEPNVARSSYWSLPVRRYLSDSRCKGSVVIFAIWPKSRRRLLVTRSESGEQRPHLTRGKYTVSSRSCVVPTCQMHQKCTLGLIIHGILQVYSAGVTECVMCFLIWTLHAFEQVINITRTTRVFLVHCYIKAAAHT